MLGKGHRPLVQFRPPLSSRQPVLDSENKSVGRISGQPPAPADVAAKKEKEKEEENETAPPEERLSQVLNDLWAEALEGYQDLSPQPLSSQGSSSQTSLSSGSQGIRISQEPIGSQDARKRGSQGTNKREETKNCGSQGVKNMKLKRKGSKEPKEQDTSKKRSPKGIHQQNIKGSLEENVMGSQEQSIKESQEQNIKGSQELEDHGSQETSGYGSLCSTQSEVKKNSQKRKKGKESQVPGSQNFGLQDFSKEESQSFSGNNSLSNNGSQDFPGTGSQDLFGRNSQSTVAGLAELISDEVQASEEKALSHSLYGTPAKKRKDDNLEDLCEDQEEAEEVPASPSLLAAWNTKGKDDDPAQQVELSAEKVEVAAVLSATHGQLQNQDEAASAPVEEPSPYPPAALGEESKQSEPGHLLQADLDTDPSHQEDNENTPLSREQRPEPQLVPKPTAKVASLAKGSVKDPRKTLFPPAASSSEYSDGSSNKKPALLVAVKSTAAPTGKKSSQRRGKQSLSSKHVNNRGGIDADKIELVPRALSKAGLLELQMRRTATTWVQCDMPGCNKWRQLQEKDPSLFAVGKWYCRQNPDPRFNSCEAREEVWEDEEITADSWVENRFTVGSLVWAELQGWPAWPAMVDDSPETGEFFETEGSVGVRRPSHYHVVFFTGGRSAVTRAWIPDAKIQPFTDRCGAVSTPKKKRKASEALNKKLAASVEQAKTALDMTLEQRRERFCFANRYNGPWDIVGSSPMKNNKTQSSSRLRSSQASQKPTSQTAATVPSSQPRTVATRRPRLMRMHSDTQSESPAKRTRASTKAKNEESNFSGRPPTQRKPTENMPAAIKDREKQRDGQKKKEKHSKQEEEAGEPRNPFLDMFNDSVFTKELTETLEKGDGTMERGAATPALDNSWNMRIEGIIEALEKSANMENSLSQPTKSNNASTPAPCTKVSSEKTSEKLRQESQSDNFRSEAGSSNNKDASDPSRAEAVELVPGTPAKSSLLTSLAMLTSTPLGQKLGSLARQLSGLGFLPVSPVTPLASNLSGLLAPASPDHRTNPDQTVPDKPRNLADYEVEDFSSLHQDDEEGDREIVDHSNDFSLEEGLE